MFLYLYKNLLTFQVWGGHKQYFGGHQPQNALQWHWACYFLSGHNPHFWRYDRQALIWVHDNWPWQTDREPTDREQRRLAEKGDPKYIFAIPRAIFPKPSPCDEIM